MSARIYIAGASSELHLIEHWMGRARAAGLMLAHDWTADVKRVGQANPREATQEERRGWVQRDIDAIRSSLLFWLLFPTTTTFGAWVELGFAASLGKTIIVSGDWRASIFTSLAYRLCDTHEEAFDWIVRGSVDT